MTDWCSLALDTYTTYISTNLDLDIYGRVLHVTYWPIQPTHPHVHAYTKRHTCIFIFKVYLRQVLRSYCQGPSFLSFFIFHRSFQKPPEYISCLMRLVTIRQLIIHLINALSTFPCGHVSQFGPGYILIYTYREAKGQTSCVATVA